MCACSVAVSPTAWGQTSEGGSASVRNGVPSSASSDAGGGEWDDSRSEASSMSVAASQQAAAGMRHTNHNAGSSGSVYAPGARGLQQQVRQMSEVDGCQIKVCAGFFIAMRNE